MTEPMKIAMAQPTACKKFLATLEAKKLTSASHADSDTIDNCINGI